MSTALDHPRPVTLDEDGYVFDDQSGEVLGRLDDRSGTLQPFEVTHPDGTVETLQAWVPAEQAAEPQPIRTRDEADAVLAELARLESRALAFDQLKAAVTRRLDAEANRLRRKAAWVERQRGPQLEAFARDQIGTGKRRSLNLTWGTLALRKVPGRFRILDQAAAVAWCEANRPELVKTTKSVTPTATGKAVADDLSIGLLDELPDWIDEARPYDAFRIDLGIKPSADPAATLDSNTAALPPPEE